MTSARLKELRELEEHSHWDVDVTVVHAALPELLDEVERLRIVLRRVVQAHDRFVKRATPGHAEAMRATMDRARLHVSGDGALDKDADLIERVKALEELLEAMVSLEERQEDRGTPEWDKTMAEALATANELLEASR